MTIFRPRGRFTIQLLNGLRRWALDPASRVRLPSLSLTWLSVHPEKSQRVKRQKHYQKEIKHHQNTSTALTVRKPLLGGHFRHSATRDRKRLRSFSISELFIVLASSPQETSLRNIQRNLIPVVVPPPHKNQKLSTSKR